MGGFVATDAMFSILSNRPKIDGKECMFPLIAGLLTFDTPYNGMARSLFAYGAFSQYQNASTLYSLWSSLSGGLGLQAASAAASSFATEKASTVPGNKQAKSVARTVGGVPASSWKRWGILAARTGTVGAVVAGGVTAYIHREVSMACSPIMRYLIRSTMFTHCYRETILHLLSITMTLPKKKKAIANSSSRLLENHFPR